MARTPSNMLALGTKAPKFELPDTTTGDTVSLSDLKSDVATVIMFICNHCPFVKHVNSELVKLAGDYQPKGVSFIAISSNDAEKYLMDSPEKMKETAIEVGYSFPYLYDQTQEVAKAYDAACTPDFYIFDGDLRLVYRGQLDDSRPDNGKPVTGSDIREALDAIFSNKPINENQLPSLGCNIKWKS